VGEFPDCPVKRLILQPLISKGSVKEKSQTKVFFWEKSVYAAALAGF